MKESYAIETRHLTKRYGEQVAVNDVCLHVPKATFMACWDGMAPGKPAL